MTAIIISIFELSDEMYLVIYILTFIFRNKGILLKMNSENAMRGDEVAWRWSLCLLIGTKLVFR